MNFWIKCESWSSLPNNDVTLSAVAVRQLSTEHSRNQPPFGAEFIFLVNSYLPLENICVVLIWL